MRWASEASDLFIWIYNHRSSFISSICRLDIKLEGVSRQESGHCYVNVHRPGPLRWDMSTVTRREWRWCSHVGMWHSITRVQPVTAPSLAQGWTYIHTYTRKHPVIDYCTLTCMLFSTFIDLIFLFCNSRCNFVLDSYICWWSGIDNWDVRIEIEN